MSFANLFWNTKFSFFFCCTGRIGGFCEFPKFCSIFEGFGGAEEDRTPDLRIANATLSHLSYGPTNARLSLGKRNMWIGCISVKLVWRNERLAGVRHCWVVSRLNGLNATRTNHAILPAPDFRCYWNIHLGYFHPGDPKLVDRL